MDRFFMLDVESGSVFEIDSNTMNVVQSSAPNKAEDFARCDISSVQSSNSIVSLESREEIQRELEELKLAGILYTEATTQSKRPHDGAVKALCLNICHDCNLACKYCFADGGSYHGASSKMSWEVARASVDFLVANSGHRRNLEIDFFGGEPLLNMSVVKSTVSYCRSLEKLCDKKFKFTITTNAVMLTPELTEYFNSEMHNVVISIDGRQAVHNTVRPTRGGKDSYDIVVANARQFVEARGERSYYIRGTFTHNNLDFASDVLALSDMGMSQISIEPVVLPPSSPLALTDSDIEQACKEYEVLCREYVARRIGESDKGAPFNFFHFNIDLTGGPCESKRLTGCGAGYEYLAIEPSGDIYPCHQFVGKPEYLMGNVIASTFDRNLVEPWSNISILTKPDCRNCWAKYYCSGGCTANAISYSSGKDGVYEHSCQLMRRRVECAIAAYSICNSLANDG